MPKKKLPIKRNREKEYFYIDIDINSRQIIGWGCDTLQEVEVELSAGFHRLFISKGQYNKLVAKLNNSTN